MILEDILSCVASSCGAYDFHTRHILLTLYSLEVYVSNPILYLDVQSV